MKPSFLEGEEPEIVDTQDPNSPSAWTGFIGAWILIQHWDGDKHKRQCFCCRHKWSYHVLFPLGITHSSGEVQQIHWEDVQKKTPSFKNAIIKRISQSTDYANQEQLCGCVLSWEANSPRVSVHAWDTQDFSPFSFLKMSIGKISYSQSTVPKTLSKPQLKPIYLLPFKYHLWLFFLFTKFERRTLFSLIRKISFSIWLL